MVVFWQIQGQHLWHVSASLPAKASSGDQTSERHRASKKWDHSTSPAITKRHATGQRTLRITTGSFDLVFGWRLERWQRRIYMIFVLMRSDESEDYKKISNHILGKRVDVFSNWKVCELRSTCYLKSENAVFFLIWRDVLMFDIHGNSEGQRRCVAYRVKSVIGWEPSWILRGSYSWWLGSYNSPIHRIFPLRLG